MMHKKCRQQCLAHDQGSDNNRCYGVTEVLGKGEVKLCKVTLGLSHTFYTCMLSTYYVSDSMQAAGRLEMNQTDLQIPESSPTQNSGARLDRDKGMAPPISIA